MQDELDFEYVAKLSAYWMAYLVNANTYKNVFQCVRLRVFRQPTQNTIFLFGFYFNQKQQLLPNAQYIQNADTHTQTHAGI